MIKPFRDKMMRYAFSGGQPTIEVHRKLGGNPDVDVPSPVAIHVLRGGRRRTREIESDCRRRVAHRRLEERSRGQGLWIPSKESREEAEALAELVDMFKRDGKLARNMWTVVHE